MYPSTGVQGRGACFATSCSSDCSAHVLTPMTGIEVRILHRVDLQPSLVALLGTGPAAVLTVSVIRRPCSLAPSTLPTNTPPRLGAKLTAWQCYQKLRNIYHARSDRGRELVGRGDPIVPVLPDPESGPARTQPEGLEGRIRLFRHKRHLQPPHRSHQLRYQATCRIARGCRNFTNYRLRCLLVADGHRPYRIKQANHA